MLLCIIKFSTIINDYGTYIHGTYIHGTYIHGTSSLIINHQMLIWITTQYYHLIILEYHTDFKQKSQVE